MLECILWNISIPIIRAHILILSYETLPKIVHFVCEFEYGTKVVCLKYGLGCAMVLLVLWSLRGL